ncbi:ABC-type transport auxiliary lipoprotein family protein [Psychromarinibacter sp. C21-152]|uniref:ABC-type transport auxiliary lipoprotein family protein n=1 Tax=Psychromarinibacter sediminicola TaxID=3033385 RepID=A0AAE3NRC1_9RHOB|nr:ABC-type transport auxiliary lipoprotein family protein [Psychromarinibacter sediminicola]MDF0600239.1 ABC-type transport auxiliary lipoprotein family protein [Psychromarinibacter sediminicola]
MTIRAIATGLLAMTLVACGEGGPRYLVESPTSELRVRSAVRTLLVRTVSLPTYAADEEIAFQDDEGVVRTMNFGLWADEPERATTLTVTRHLNAMTSAKVAPEPWPLPRPPEGVVDIRIETYIATNADTFRISGQYFLGSEEPEPEDNFDDPDYEPRTQPPPLPDRVGVFDISVALVGEGPSAIATAQAAALTRLSEKIARDLVR